MLEDRGIDSSRVVVSEPTTIEKFRSVACQILDSYLETAKENSGMLMVLDSLGMLSSEKEVADVGSGADTRDMTKSSLIKGAFRVLTLKLSKAKVPLIVCNHLYANIGGYGPIYSLSGGSGLKYSASTIVNMDKIER